MKISTGSSHFNLVRKARKFGSVVSSSPFVPKHEPTKQSDVHLLKDFVTSTSPEKLLILTGAGLSTESGIPDYRSEDVGLYATSDRRPIQHKMFMDKESARRSYWARNFLGWPRWSSITPNPAHVALSQWEHKGLVQCLVTQNVDQLHFKAGSNRVVELHGTNSLVRCMNCCYTTPRLLFQSVLTEHNPDLLEKTGEHVVRPDGDLDIPEDIVRKFKVPSCPKCSTGILKPNVIFFGDNVPRVIVEKVKRLVNECESLLVIGSSLYVFSGYRFVHQAKELGKKIAIVNIGKSRADGMEDLRIHAKAGDILSKIKLP